MVIQENKMLMSGSNLNQLEAVDLLKAIWQTMNKHIKTKVSYISRHPAGNIIECIDDILQFNLVSPGKGTQGFSVQRLTGTNTHWVSYKRNMAVLEQRSSELMTFQIKQNFGVEGRSLLRPFLINLTHAEHILTVSDTNVGISERNQGPALMKFGAKDTRQMVKLAKRWLSANAIFTLSLPFVRLLCEGRMLPRFVARVSANEYLDMSGHSKLRVTVETGDTFHMIAERRLESNSGSLIKISYKHIFFVQQSPTQVTVVKTERKNKKGYIEKLDNFVAGKTFFLGRQYQCEDDLIEFRSLTDKEYKLRVFEGCNFLCLTSSETVIPLTVIETNQHGSPLNMGYTLRVEDSANAFQSIRRLVEMAESGDEFENDSARVIAEMILNTNYGQHTMDTFMFTINLGVPFVSPEAIDVVRAFLYCSKKRYIPDGVLVSYINNSLKTARGEGLAQLALSDIITERSTSLLSPILSDSGSDFMTSDSSWTNDSFASDFDDSTSLPATYPRKNVPPDHLTNRRLFAYVKRCISHEVTSRRFRMMLRDYSALEVPMLIHHFKTIDMNLINQFSNQKFSIPLSVSVAVLRHTIGDMADHLNPFFNFTLPFPR
jgi:hypothetical protein